MLHSNPQCTHTYDHISQQLDSLADTEQQQMLYSNEADASLFTADTSTPCQFNITPSDLETESLDDVYDHSHNNTSIHFYSKHKYRDTFGDAHIQYHDFDNGDAFMYKDTQHYYNKNYKTPIGVYMIQLQPKAIRYLLTWTLKPCLTPCILLAIHTQLLKLIMSHTKLYSTMIMVCSQLN